MEGREGLERSSVGEDAGPAWRGVAWWGVAGQGWERLAALVQPREDDDDGVYRESRNRSRSLCTCPTDYDT